MKTATATIAGTILLLIGIIALAYQGIVYTTHKSVFAVGSIHATEAQEHRARLPPVLGCVALIGGVVLLASGAKESRDIK